MTVATVTVSTDDSVEQRCARIRGRMQWILSQLEPADGNSPLALKPSRLSSAAAPSDEQQRRLDAQRRTLDAQRQLELDRARAAHATAVAGLRAQLAAAREDGRDTQASEMAALRSQLAAERKARAAEKAALEDARAREAREASAQMRDSAAASAQQEGQTRKEASALRERLAVCERALKLSRTALAEALPHLPAARGHQRPADAALAAADAVLGAPGAAEAPPAAAASSRGVAAAAPQPSLLEAAAATCQSAVSSFGGGCGAAAAAPSLSPPPVRVSATAAESAAQPRAAKAAAAPPPVPPPVAEAAPPPVPPRPPARVSQPAAAESGSPASARAVVAPTPHRLPPSPTNQPTAVPNVAVAVALPSLPPSERPRLFARHYAYTHAGGSKPADSTNQDTYFTLRMDEHNIAWAVFDGHGGDNGEAVARVASACIEDFLRTSWARLRDDPEAAFVEAFQLAQAEVKRSLLAADSSLEERDGVLFGKWTDEAGAQVEEAADGGTTATVLCLVDGATLVHAQVGDSSALLGGTMPGEDGAAEVTFEELIREHAATHEGEYERVLGTPRGSRMQFVYDVGELIDQGQAPPIFKKDLANGGYCLDPKSIRVAEAHGTPAKNARGDLPAILLTPAEGDAEPQSLAMTRSIGDFYLQRFGVSWRPEVITVDLQEVSAELSNLTLLLASDGVWDLWEYQPAFELAVQEGRADALATAVELRGKTFFRESLAMGAEIFGDTADNMTGILVYFSPTPQTDGGQGVARGGARPSKQEEGFSTV